MTISKHLKFLLVVYAAAVCSLYMNKINSIIKLNQINFCIEILSFASCAVLLNPTISNAGMLTFPLPVPLKNNIILVI
jgi:hypothetical protein